MEGEYKGFLIEYNRHSLKAFVVGDLQGKYETLDNAEKAIDRHLKKNRNIGRLKVIKSGHWGKGFHNAEITSITEEGRVWTIDEDGKREMVRGSHFICERTDENDELIMMHIKMKAEGQKMKDDADALLLTCSRGTIDKMIEKMTVKVG